MREQLEQNILDNPTDDAPRLIYADWLEENSEPERAEFIRVQIALEADDLGNKKRKELIQREKELLDQYQRKWLGGLGPYLLDNEGAEKVGNELNCKFMFLRGFLDEVYVRDTTYYVAKAMCVVPETKWISKLHVEGMGAYFDGEPIDPEDEQRIGDVDGDQVGFYQLAQSPFLTNVRWFALGEYEMDSCHVWCEAVPDIVSKMPRIEELHLFCRQYDLKKLFNLKTLSNLRVLRIHHMGDYANTGAEVLEYAHPFEVLAKNPAVRNLRTLDIHPRNSEVVDSETQVPLSYLPLAQVRYLFDCEKFPHLEHLRLDMSDMGDEGCKLLVESGILKQLKVLDLSYGRITDKGAQLLVDCPDAKNLELLNLYGNGLDEVKFDALREAGVTVVDDYQLEIDALEQGAYLFYGDYE